MTKEESILFETPVAYPLIGDHNNVYIVNDSEGSIRLADTSSDVYQTFALNDISCMIGLSSVSEISYESDTAKNVNSKSATVVTSPVADRVLAITRIIPNDEPTVMYLDLSMECSIFTESVVAVKTFSCCEGKAMQLVLVDASGVILTLRFTIDSLTPIAVPRGANGEATDVRSFIPAERAGAGGHFAPGSVSPTVSSTMVTFVASDILVLSLNPHFMSVDLLNETVHSWSKSMCLDEMRARSSGLRSIFQKSAERLLFGKWETVVFDMDPVAAVCNVDNDPLTVFTLHADGVVRHWTMTPDTLAPYSVRDILLTKKHLPDPALWSIEAHHRSYLTARRYGSVFALCIHVQVEDSYQKKETDADDMSESSPDDGLSKHVIVAVDVPTDPEDDEVYATLTHAIPLTVPITNANSCVIDMQFDPRSERSRMLALFLTRTDSSPAFTSSVLCTYNPSSVAILSHQPSVLNPDLMIDGVAREEHERINSLSFGTKLLQRTDLLLDHTIFEMDRQFMKYLFRPIYPRASGTVLPPKPHHIRWAMQGLFPSFRMSSNLRIELEVGAFVTQCRKHARRGAIASPVKRPPKTYASTPTDAKASYSTLELNDVVEVQDEDGNSVNFVEESEATYCQIEREVLEHEHLWKNLLLLVAQHESLEVVPVGMLIASSCTDAAVVVRAGCVCSLTSTKQANEQRALSDLDETVITLMDILTRHKSTSVFLTDLEHSIRESLLSGELATNPEAIDLFKGRLNGSDVLARNPESIKLTRGLERISHGQWKALLNDGTLACSLPGLCLIPERWLSSLISTHAVSLQAAMGIQGRLAASSLLMRTMDSVRQLCYARWIVVSTMNVSAATESLALRMYLHSLAVMGVAAQTVKDIPFVGTDVQHFDTDTYTLTSPPKKRSKMSNFLDANETLASDSLLMTLSRRLSLSTLSHGSLAESVLHLGMMALAASFQFGNKNFPQGAEYIFPELGLLSSTNGDITEPRLALCLLSSSVALQVPEDSAEVSKYREALLAQCLILSSRSKSPIEANAMIDKALSLLPFDALNLEKSTSHLRILESRMVDKVTGGQRLVTYIHDAITSCRLANLSVDSSIFEILFLALFSASISIREWSQAYRAASEYPVGEKRLEKYERLIMAMVDAGALEELLAMASQPAMINEAIQNVVYLAGIVTDTLSKMTTGMNLYALLGVRQETMPDYSNALFAVQVSLQHWRSASESMDMRFVNAREALKADFPELNQEQQILRYRLMVDDMAFATASALSSMSMEFDDSARYLVSGKRENDSQVPYDLSENGDKADMQISNAKTPVRYMNLIDLELRAVRVKVLKTLFFDSDIDDSFLMEALTNEGSESALSNDDICDRLFRGGFYADGLLLARTADKSRGCSPQGRSIFYGCVSHLILDYLVPLAMDSDCTPQRPTMLQIKEAVEYLNLDERRENPVLVVSSRSKKTTAMVRAEIRASTMGLIRELTFKYTSIWEPLAEEVAKEMLRPHRAATALPPWLESHLISGTLDHDLPGLFSRRRTADSPEDFLGNPVALLDMYTSSGLLSDACKLVTTVLMRGNCRAQRVTSRRPESGEIDDLPERKIDLLWNLIDGRLQTKLLLGDERTRTVEARVKMEKSLEMYFTLMKISEKGLLSARALQL